MDKTEDFMIQKWMLNDMEGSNEGSFSLIAEIEGGDEQETPSFDGSIPVRDARFRG